MKLLIFLLVLVILFVVLPNVIGFILGLLAAWFIFTWGASDNW